MSKSRRILFLTGTRADFGKIKSLLLATAQNNFEVHLYITGMHLLKAHGYTYREIAKLPIKHQYKVPNHRQGPRLDLILSATIQGLGPVMEKTDPDLVVVHGDRTEALAGAIVAAFNNRRVAHIEGGEVSGTIDESIRHAITKLAHIHFVSNQIAQKRLVQMGEDRRNIFVIGSPNLDYLKPKHLPDYSQVKQRHELAFGKFAIVLYHPVTTEIDQMLRQAHHLIAALNKSGLNYLVIYPNNDPGSEIIFKTYQFLENNPRFIFRPSLPFEDFLCLLKKSLFLIGNSSAGIQEAPYLGIPTINIGTRQQNRVRQDELESIRHCPYNTATILNAIREFSNKTRFKPQHHFGRGDSHRRFVKTLKGDIIWQIPLQKKFYDLPA